MTSMEEFGPVSVDYFHGRAVEEVIAGKGGAGDPVWSVRFEGGGLLHNYDPTYSAPPPEIVGMVLTLTQLGIRQTSEAGEGTVLYFGDRLAPRRMQVHLNALQYAIQDETYTRGEIVYAQRSRANMPPMPTHPDERVVDGPEGSPDG